MRKNNNNNNNNDSTPNPTQAASVRMYTYKQDPSKLLPAELSKEGLADNPIDRRGQVNHLGKVNDLGGQINQQAERAQFINKHRQQEIRGGLFLNSNAVVLVLEVLNNVASSETGRIVVGARFHLRCLGELVEESGRSGQGNGASDCGLGPERRR